MTAAEVIRLPARPRPRIVAGLTDEAASANSYRKCKGSSPANSFHFGNGSNQDADSKEILAAGGTRGGNSPSNSALRVLVSPKPPGGLAVLDRLLEDGTLDAHQHAAALAYGALRRRYDRSGGPMRSWRDRSGMSDKTWQTVKRDHARMIRAAGAERFVLDRLVLDDDAPLSSEVERVRAALERVFRTIPALNRSG